MTQNEKKNLAELIQLANCNDLECDTDWLHEVIAKHGLTWKQVSAVLIILDEEIDDDLDDDAFEKALDERLERAAQVL